MKEFRQVKREIPNEYYRYKFSYISGGFEYYFDANNKKQKAHVYENDSWQEPTRNNSNYILTTN